MSSVVHQASTTVVQQTEYTIEKLLCSDLTLVNTSQHCCHQNQIWQPGTPYWPLSPTNYNANMIYEAI